MSRSTLPLLAAVLASAAVPAVAGAQSPPPAGTVSATGAASVSVEPNDRRSNTSIAKAVEAAQDAALPLAIKAANARARALATQSGLGLGVLIGVSDQPGGSPFYYSPFGVDGTFGPGRYCGNVPRYRTTRLANGRIRRTRIGTRRQCRIPSRVGASVVVTYAAIPTPTPVA